MRAIDAIIAHRDDLDYDGTNSSAGGRPRELTKQEEGQLKKVIVDEVGQEGHPASGIACLRNLHNHAACAFPQNHRWKAIEKHLREKLGFKVQGSQ